MKAVPRHSPRHYPEFRAEFEPRGWSIFRTGDADPTAHGVFCATIPGDCVARYGFTEHIQANPEVLRTELERTASAFEAHTKVCAECSRALENAVQRAKSQ
ncbi:hypothetical protein FHX37_4609 [Haloactinospora alba]|uniref:Uncharacterized protein n=1 Tax=Haloactinospora alba TaxID=405555 RepID=A0A543N2N3_9ACTN|nr:hypothetical protein FHX37_4609 [Haloactinospora alba]